MTTEEIRQPKWIRASMTVEAAAREADKRGCFLRAHFNPTMGLIIVAVKRETQQA